MKKLSVLAALLMATTSAYAGNSISFEINGKKVRIEAPDHCDQLSCLRISAPGLSAADFGFKGSTFTGDGVNDDDDAAPRTEKPAVSAAAPAGPVAAPRASANPVASASPAATMNASPTTAAPIRDEAAGSSPVENSAPAPTSTPVAAAPAPATPLGVWATEEHKGMVRIEPCGEGLCGYADKTGEKILINMKPSGAKWTGRIHDPDSGRNYDSTIVMKGANTLRVEGCAFGGLFCGGQSWSRVS